MLSGSLGVDWTFFERDIYLIAHDGLGFADGACGKLEYGSGLDANCGQTPRLQGLFYVDDNPVAVEVDGVDGKAHGEGVDAVGGVDPEALAAVKSRRWLECLRPFSLSGRHDP